ncbi:uncharacterized protein HMPREF1541_10366 [Cyphellophora europaea CBS 101466]|uniref:Uncharacterized protein n=1 Tax=Cyphellophora europaea (strain CBS 101466) TaxID=1220924 RepID=W2S7K9_CYPE1|nr:uncharacterized protein HMPREF1541_10366 [Cyphellophora europaea CBS 101466]ETN44696.1 hypothetical protein HMPREF1541_10366 [Cyphellophora europaea CBS 101466]
MSLYASVTTYPPLSQLTVIPTPSPSAASPLAFTALLSTHRDRPNYPFIVHLHYTPTSAPTAPPSQWPYTTLTESAADSDRDVILAFVRTEAEANAERRRVYRGVLPPTSGAEGVSKGQGGNEAAGGRRLKFALRYKIDQYAGWRWAESYGGVSVGEVLFSSSLPQNVEEEQHVRTLLGVTDGWTITSCDSAAPATNASIFEVTSDTEHIPKVPDGTPAFGSELAGKVLGKVRGQVRYMGLVRLEPYWLGVQHSASQGGEEGFFDMSMDGLLVCWLLEDGRVLGVLAWAGEGVYEVIRAGNGGEVVVAARNDTTEEKGWGVLVGVGNDLEGVVAGVMAEAKRRAVDGEEMKRLLSRVEEVGRREEWAGEDWFDGLAYCTWNGLDMHRCDEKAVLEGLAKLDSEGVKIETFLLDDCWQSLGDHKIGSDGNEWAGWDKFEPNDNFPRGLKPLIDEIRSKHQNIKSFGIWHALFGYWGCINPNGDIASNYKTRQIRTKVIGNISRTAVIVDPSDIDRFYDDLYAWLKGQGVDFVKTDVQHMLSMLEDAKDREEIPTAYQRAWTTAVCKHFQGKAISCMSQTPQTMLHSLLQDRTPKVMHRNSDDFYPDITDSNPWHIVVNAHNALLDRHLNVIPDWDMFQTSHPWSSYHAAARAISGGPILITDIPGRHDPELIAAMTAANPAGTLIALRPRPAAVTDPWRRYADGELCKIGTGVGGGKGAVGLLGVFNIVEGEVSELLSVDEFPDVEAQEVVVTSQRTGQVLGPLKRSGGALVGVAVAGRGWDILTAAPVLQGGGVSLAVMGLRGKMSGAAAVTRQAVSGSGDGAKVKLALKALGRLGLWVGKEGVVVKDVVVEGKKVKEEYVSSKKQHQGTVFEVDLLKYWEDHNLWSVAEELEVEVSIG